jgi:hypothetical protein
VTHEYQFIVHRDIAGARDSAISDCLNAIGRRRQNAGIPCFLQTPEQLSIIGRLDPFSLRSAGIKSHLPLKEGGFLYFAAVFSLSLNDDEVNHANAGGRVFRSQSQRLVVRSALDCIASALSADKDLGVEDRA